jgi:hypothetical protein
MNDKRSAGDTPDRPLAYMGISEVAHVKDN